jgi:hypothetical protein
VASKCPTRGILEDDDGPLTADDLADKTGFPVEYFRKAFNVLTQKEIGWLECDEHQENLLEAQDGILKFQGGREVKTLEVKGIEQTPKSTSTPPAQLPAGVKEGLLFDPGVQIPQDDEKDAGKGQETQMQGKPAKPKKAKKAKTDGEPKINAWKIWIDVCVEQGLKDPVWQDADGSAAKNIAKAIGDAKKVEHVFRMYLQDRDPWLLGHGHGLRYIGARVNRYLNDSGGVGIPGEVWADDAEAEAEAIITGKIETPF